MAPVSLLDQEPLLRPGRFTLAAAALAWARQSGTELAELTATMIR
jgi:hypothetical protein